MSDYDPRSAVVVGVGQLSRRVDAGELPLEPVALMVEAARRAAQDAGSARVLSAVQSVQVVHQLSWRYRDPGRLVAEQVGAPDAATLTTTMGGNWAQSLVNRTAAAIAAGTLDVALLCGAEAWRSRGMAKSGELVWTPIERQEGVDEPETLGADDPPLVGQAELARGIVLPTQVYPMFDVALRARLGLGVDEHRDRIAALWARFSEVAEANPNAWIRRRLSPAEVREASPDNRMIGFPYTKVMNSNNNVDQGAALLVTSAARAAELGVPRDRWVWIHSGADAHDHWDLSTRDDLCSSPAMRLAGGAALDLAGVGPDDLRHVDLYSCFPSAVQIAADELGLGLDRDLTVTGGMSFAGGPWNNYPMHAIATMVPLLRDDPTATGLCTANGGYTTKHAFGVYAARPPAAGTFRHAKPQAAVDATPSRTAATDHVGDVTIEAYTVTHDRDGAPASAPLALRTPDGRRAWGTTDDADAMAELMATECVGRPATLDAEGRVRF